MLVQIPREQLTPGWTDRDAGAAAPPAAGGAGRAPEVYFARFDLAALRHDLGIAVASIYCTRTASKLVRTYTERHGLSDLALELLDVEMDKSVRHTDWASDDLRPEQVRYAMSDVTMLLPIMDRLAAMLAREERNGHRRRSASGVIPTLVRLHLMGYAAPLSTDDDGPGCVAARPGPRASLRGGLCRGCSRRCR